MANLPDLRFYRLLSTARAPQRADRSACGTLPTRAFRYCEAVTSATAFGWWLFPPMDMQVYWDGHDVHWHFDGADSWLPLQPAAQFPDFAAAFDAAAPEDMRGCSPPFLTALPEPGTFQLWTGLLARSAPDWHLLLRSPANLPATGGLVAYEGIVATDRWFGPLFVNFRFTRSHAPIRLRPDYPLVLAQPVHRTGYDASVMGAMEVVPDMGGMTAQDWDAYRRAVVAPNREPDRAYGRYAVSTRKAARAGSPGTARGLCPVVG